MKKNFITSKVWIKDKHHSHESEHAQIHEESKTQILPLMRKNEDAQRQYIVSDALDWQRQRFNFEIKEQKDRKIASLVKGLKVNDYAKKKIANTMRETMNFNHRGMLTTYQKSSSLSNLPKVK